jgi:transposase
VARKLMVIGWQMLTKREAYRYAQPAATERKLQKLRVRATGAKRKTGPKAGSVNEPKLGAGVKSRTIPALADVLQAEGLPRPMSPPPGETRTIAEAGCTEYVNSLSETQVKAKRPRRVDG